MLDNAKINQLIKEASTDILRFSPQLYVADSRKLPVDNQPIGTAILFRDNLTHFLITASHVYQSDDGAKIRNGIGITIGNHFIPIQGDLKYSHFGINDNNRSIDLAICQLSQSTVDLLKPKYDFLQIDQILIDHAFDIDRRYLLVGFPVGRSKVDFHTHRISPRPFAYLTRPFPEDYLKLVGIDNPVRVFMYYDKKKLLNYETDTVSRSPELAGISGCGLWIISSPSRNLDYRTPKLVGIVLQEHAKEKAISCLRSEIVTEILRRDFGCKIPESKRKYL